MSTDNRGCISSLAGLFTSLALFLLALSVLLVLIFIFIAAVMSALGLRFVTRRYLIPQFYPATAVFAEQRLFGAPPDSQLFSAYDYWLACLEQATLIPFTQSPTRLIFGSILITLTPAFVVGLPMLFLDPQIGCTLFPVLLLFGVLFGGFTGYRLGQPAGGWFPLYGGTPHASDEALKGGFTLGDEEW